MKQLNYRNYYDNYWYAEVANFGWRSQNGSKVFKASNGTELLSEVLPNTDCTFYIHRSKDKRSNVIKIQNFHHDSPVGNEWYTIRPATYEEVEDFYFR